MQKCNNFFQKNHISPKYVVILIHTQKLGGHTTYPSGHLFSFYYIDITGIAGM